MAKLDQKRNIGNESFNLKVAYLVIIASMSRPSY